MVIISLFLHLLFIKRSIIDNYSYTVKIKTDLQFEHVLVYRLCVLMSRIFNSGSKTATSMKNIPCMIIRADVAIF